jgi:hypothetical protein
MGVVMPPPSYSDTIEKIYIEATKAAIRYDNSLTIPFGVAKRKDHPSLPFWVPDYNAPSTHGISRFSVGRYLKDFWASNNTSTKSWFLEEDELLGVRCVIVDTITDCSALCYPDLSTISSLQEITVRLRELFREWTIFAKGIK